ncbi:MAG: EutN/CcmL family microcompartment protein [bacterium]|nr:EutN/CcmL family microcompartment protein [bacterium]
MFLGVVRGNLVATRKVPDLEGCVFRVVQPINQDGTNQGKLIIAADMIPCSEGDVVYLVKSREATIPWPKPLAPLDATIVGLVDGIDQ